MSGMPIVHTWLLLTAYYFFVSVHMRITLDLTVFTFGESEMGWHPIMRAEALSPFCEGGKKRKQPLYISISHINVIVHDAISKKDFH